MRKKSRHLVVYEASATLYSTGILLPFKTKFSVFWYKSLPLIPLSALGRGGERENVILKKLDYRPNELDSETFWNLIPTYPVKVTVGLNGRWTVPWLPPS